MAIKKRSKVPGVMITQFVEEIPPGKSHPDFTRKPIALTIQEGKIQRPLYFPKRITLCEQSLAKQYWLSLFLQTGKLAFFKAIVTGNPTPTVKWARNNGDISDAEKYIVVYEKSSGEHQLQVPYKYR